MSDESDPPAVIAFPRPQPSPPKPESDPPEKIGLFEASITLRDLLAEVIGGDYSKLDWAVAEALRLIDPGERSPPLMRYSARMQAAAAREEARELGYWKGRLQEKAGVDNGWDGGRWAVQAFDRPKPQKMSAEFISAAISLAGRLRRDWGSGAAWGLPHDTLKALEALLEALGERIDGSRRVR